MAQAQGENAKQNTDIKVSELTQEKVQEINKILERVLQEKEKAKTGIGTFDIFDLHVAL